MWRPSILLAAALAVPSQALHFFLDGAVTKCFYEELPKDTLVVGHYHAECWDDTTKTYISRQDVGVFVTVEEVFDNNHRIVSQRGASTGKFTFSAADSGQHRICVNPQNVPSSGWLSSGIHGTVKFTLDMAIGETSRIEATDKDKVETLVQRVKDLNSRLQDVRREQIFQRVGGSLQYSFVMTKREIGKRLADIYYRSVRLNSVISPKLQMAVWFDGHSFNSLS